MPRFIFRRVLEMIPVLWIVATIVFFMVRFVPGGPFEAEKNLPAIVKAQLHAHYGLDKPLAVQYGKYLANLAQGDLGPSYQYPGWTVNELLADRIGVSAELGLWGLLTAVCVGIPLGALAASRPNSPVDHVPSALAAVGISVPTFVLGPLVILFVSLKLGWFHALGWNTPGDRVLPALVLGLVFAAPVMRLTRASMLEVRNQDYMRTARAKGLSETRIYFVHGLRNALLPVVTYLGPATAGLISGSFVVESMFDIPGLGKLFVMSAFNREYTMICGTALFYAAALLVLNLLADVLAVALNPRLKYE